VSSGNLGKWQRSVKASKLYRQRSVATFAPLGQTFHLIGDFAEGEVTTSSRWRPVADVEFAATALPWRCQQQRAKKPMARMADGLRPRKWFWANGSPDTPRKEDGFMGLRAILKSWFQDDRMLRAMASDAARRCETAVWQHVGPRASTMPLAEARGYVRARSAGIVRRQVELVLLGRPELSTPTRIRIHTEAHDLAVVRAIDVMRTRAVTQPALRRAA
jgi:hypothetical protein